MDASRFDSISRLFADRRLSRRQVVTATAAGALTTGLLASSPISAQDEATPIASPVVEPVSWEKTTYLFVQSFQSGTITPNDDDDRHTLTLEQGLGQTLYFGDRPSRDVGTSPTETFLRGLGFSADNPPNAALIVDAGDGETDLAVLELFDPTYDVATHTATYQVRGLEAWEDSLELGLQDTPSDLSGITPVFGTAHLLIDDCADTPVTCTNNAGGSMDTGSVGFCYNYAQCIPCEPYGHSQPDRCATWGYWGQKCDSMYSSDDADICADIQGGCSASWPLSIDLGCPD